MFYLHVYSWVYPTSPRYYIDHKSDSPKEEIGVLFPMSDTSSAVWSIHGELNPDTLKMLLVGKSLQAGFTRMIQEDSHG